MLNEIKCYREFAALPTQKQIEYMSHLVNCAPQLCKESLTWHFGKFDPHSQKYQLSPQDNQNIKTRITNTNNFDDLLEAAQKNTHPEIKKLGIKAREAYNSALPGKNINP